MARASFFGKGKGPSEPGPFADPSTDWFKCQNCDKGWCFEGDNTPTHCKHCFTGEFDLTVKYDRYGYLTPGQVIKPAEKKSIMADTTLKQLVEQQGCDLEANKKLLTDNGMVINPPTKPPTSDPLSVQLTKAEAAEAKVEKLVVDQLGKSNRIRGLLLQSEVH